MGAMKVTAMSQSGITATWATATGLKGADCKKVLASLAAVATKEVKSTGKFTVPGLAMLKLKTKPATKAGKREMFGKVVVVKAKLINSKIRKDHFEHMLHSALTSPSATKIVARPQLPFNIIHRIRKSSEKIFEDLGFRDFAIINGIILGENFDIFLLPCKNKNKKSIEKTELAILSYKFLMLKQFKNPTIQSFEIEELVYQLNIRIGTKNKKFEYLKQYLTTLIEKNKTNLDFTSLDKVSKISIKTKEFIDYENYRSKKNS